MVTVYIRTFANKDEKVDLSTIESWLPCIDLNYSFHINNSYISRDGINVPSYLLNQKWDEGNLPGIPLYGHMLKYNNGYSHRAVISSPMIENHSYNIVVIPPLLQGAHCGGELVIYNVDNIDSSYNKEHFMINKDVIIRAHYKKWIIVQFPITCSFEIKPLTHGYTYRMFYYVEEPNYVDIKNNITLLSHNDEINRLFIGKWATHLRDGDKNHITRTKYPNGTWSKGQGIYIQNIDNDMIQKYVNGIYKLGFKPYKYSICLIKEYRDCYYTYIDDKYVPIWISKELKKVMIPYCSKSVYDNKTEHTTFYYKGSIIHIN